MSDAFIPSGERDQWSASYVKKSALEIAASHAAADELIRELANTLREFLPDDKRYAENSAEVKAHHVLRRVDALYPKEQA